MKYLSVCSGIEAATVAWHQFGWHPVAFSEIEPFPSAVLEHHYPGIPNLGDMTKFSSWPDELLAEVDIVVGGPPCQAFSVAGLRRSLDDDRGNVTLAYVRMIDHIDAIRRANGRPPVIAVYENVPGLLSTRDNAFGCFVGALCGCDEAPETQSGKWPKAGLLCGEARRVGYRVLDAQYFGVAQRRRRIFLVAMPCELVERFGERACPSEILALSESVSGNPAPSRKAWEGTSRTSAGSTAGSGEQPFGVANCLTQRMHKGINTTVDEGQTPIVFHVTQDPIPNEDGVTHAISSGNRNGCCTAGVAFTKAKRAQSIHDDESWVPGRVAPTQNQFDIGDTRATTVVAFANRTRDGIKLPEVMNGSVTPALTNPGRGGRSDAVNIAQARSVRRLTPRECERLQGFPDDYTEITYRNKPAADGPRYKALGNSMAVPCMFWVGNRILHATR